MRVLQESIYSVDPLENAADPSVVRVECFRSALAADLEDQIAAKVAELVSLNFLTEGPSVNWAMAYCDLGGSGYGSEFMCCVHFVNTLHASVQSDDLLDLATLEGGNDVGAQIFFYEGADGQSLKTGWELTQQRVWEFGNSAPVPADHSFKSAIVRQTCLEGATQGTKFLGAVLAEAHFIQID